ncbi:hypothetical protein AYI70_g10964 [Smittium culicis]|uniref:Uncharacterized protein n=1 Tax=Smittium culicis TaxID=133412 RepID=A0A1R1X3Z9_9FUNG|nr:hypothetical protein AYI70_g10964 [Smittium culicis]
MYRSAVSSHGIDSESARKLMKTYQDFKDHKMLVDEQRGRFTSLEGNLNNDSCILIYDFKENFKIGGGLVESLDVFYSRIQISDLCFCLVYKSNGHIKRRYYNYLFENLIHDSVYALSCLLKLLKSPDFAIFKNIYLWSGSGPHFGNSEFLYAVMKALPESFPRKIFFLNYFLENHGKSYVDDHFGVLSKWFNESESIMDITSIDDLMGIFRSKNSDLAAQRGVYTDDVCYNFIKYDQYTPRGYKYTMRIDSFKNYLSFFKLNNYLMACPISTMSPSDYEPKNFRLKVYKDVRNDRFAPSAPSISPNECVIMGPKSHTVHNSRVLWLKNHTNTTS